MFNPGLQCIDGDVKLGSDGTPFYFKSGKFHPICRRRFNVSVHGARLFCKKLGYDSGVVSSSGFPLEMDAIGVGECLKGDADISSCTGQCSTYDVAGMCPGLSSKCGVGFNGGITINCIGGKNIRTSSCKGKTFLRFVIYWYF